MKIIKKIARFFCALLFALIIAVCMVLGIGLVVPKRKEQFGIEMKMEENKKRDETKENTVLFEGIV